MKRKLDSYHGILLLNKPSGISSHTAVDRVRKIICQRSIGHAGTLDPAAEGLLVLLLGKATKVARFLTDQDKEYEAEICLGLESTTYDAEGLDPEAKPLPIPVLDAVKLDELLARYRGTITQKVPPYSAVHVDGERLYRRSRRGETVDPPERTVRVHRLDLVSFSRDRLRLRLACSKGTYVRSLAHDIGRQLGCGGYLASLRRTRVGRFLVDDSLTVEQVGQWHQNDRLRSVVISMERALDFSTVTVSDQFRPLVLNGRRPRISDIANITGDFQSGDRLLLKDQHGSVLAIGTATVGSERLNREWPDEVLKYDRVFN